MQRGRDAQGIWHSCGIGPRTLRESWVRGTGD
jgi:hypothetical protein